MTLTPDIYDALCSPPTDGKSRYFSFTLAWLLCFRSLRTSSGEWWTFSCRTFAVTRLRAHAPSTETTCPKALAFMSQARHGPLWASSLIFVPFDASLVLIPVFVYPRGDPSPPPVDLQPALVGRPAAASQSGDRSPTGYFFLCGFHWDLGRSNRYSAWILLRTIPAPSLCRLSAPCPCLHARCYVLDVQTRHIGYIRDVSAPRLLSTPVDPCLTGSRARSCTARIKASVPVFCSCLELLMLATSSVCCSRKPRNCFPCSLEPQNGLRIVEESVVLFLAAELLLADFFVYFYFYFFVLLPLFSIKWWSLF